VLWFIGMGGKNLNYNAIVSSDWNECLAPCGPFDCISFNYPELKSDLENIFKQYTGNIISLGRAVLQIQQLLPGPITEEHMDAYLDQCFITYQGVPELIEWCLSNNILFMINTTGVIGYFQRIYAKGLLPHPPVISAHPLVRYSQRGTDPQYVYDLIEIEDKGKNTEVVVRSLNIPAEKTILMGDSGGDGPHFKWGAERGAFLVGSMIKPSLEKYCRTKGVRINLRFGLSYVEGEKKDLQKEMQTDFRDLSNIIEEFLGF
jgi:phosphoserine phosphatase